jgi:hypothetical protein
MSADTVTPPPVTPSPPNNPPAAPPVSRRRWLRRLLPPFTLLVLAVWFAPAVVANTGLRNRLARLALADVRGSVEVGGASVGWFSPVELRDVTLTDEAGRTVVRVPRVTSQKSLFDLARNRAEPGAFTLENPTVALVCETDTTNLEAALAEYLKDDGAPPAPARTPVALTVTGGTLTLTDPDTGRSATVEGISAAVSVPASRAEPVAVKVATATGRLDAELSLGDTGTLKLTCTDLPLETFAPLLKRADAGLTLAGAGTADVSVRWGKDAPLTVAGTAGVKRFALSAPWTNGDTLALDAVSLPLDVDLAGRVVRVRKFELACDAGTLSAAGTFDPAHSADQLFAQAGVSVAADVDLARLAAKLPKLLRLRAGTELREGRIAAKLASRADPAGVVWAGEVTTSAVKGTRAGQPLAWDQPLHAEFAGRYASGRLPTFDKLVCTADFIAVNARTTPETVQAAANVYLHKLAAHLAEFADLGGVELDGEAAAQLVGRREPDGAFRLSGSVALKNVAVTDHAGKGFREPALDLKVSATGQAPATGPIELATATLALVAGGDELDVSLLTPVGDVRNLAGGTAEVRVTGDVRRWAARAAAVAPLPPYDLSGALDGRARVRFAGDTVAADRLTIGLTNFRFRGAGCDVAEPRLTAVGDLTVSRATGAATVTKLALTSAPLSVTDATVAVEAQNGGTVVSADGRCVVDLNRLGAAFKLPPANALAGRAAGPLRVRAAGDRIAFGGALDVTNFAYGPAGAETWAEPTLRLEADGTYTGSSDVVALAVAKAERPGLAVDVTGSVANLATTRDVTLTGSVRYDWAKLGPLVRDLLGGDFEATGGGTRAVALTGRLAPAAVRTAALPPPESKGGPVALRAPGAPPARSPAPAGPGALAALTGEAALGWESIRSHGFDVGPGELKATMTRGVVTVAPITATFCGGKVTLAPTVKFDSTPGEVVLAAGPVVDHAKLSPRATAGALGYALPAFAKAGEADGEISATVGANRIPLDDFARAEIGLTLVIHKATVGAGPLATELATVLGAKATTMTLAAEEAVPVRVANGRVYHEHFGFRVGGTTLHTSGSVGFDDTLDLVVDVPLPKDLPALKNNPILLKSVAGKVVKVPVTGTLTRPQIDKAGFERAVLALARDGARDAGKDAIEKELNKLFPGAAAPKGGGLPFPFGPKP